MSSSLTIKAFLLIGILITGVFILVPVFHAIQLSFYDLESYVSEPRWVGLEKYREVLGEADFWRGLWNGIIFAGFSIALQVALGIGIALVLNQRFVGRGVLRGLAILPYLLPTVVVAVTFQWMLDGSLGIITLWLRDIGFGSISWFETPTAAMATVVFVSVWIWTPFVTTCFLAALQTVPEELYHAAKVDGTNAWQRFWHVTIPMLKPVLTVIVLLRAIWMFNKFDIVWLLTKGGPVGATEHLPILAYRKAFTLFDIGGGAAVATLSFLILSAVVFVYFRLFPLEER